MSDKSYKKTVIQRPSITAFGREIKGQTIDVVVNPYSGKYYGEAKPEVFLKHYSQVLKGTQEQINYVKAYGQLPTPVRNPFALNDPTAPMSVLNIHQKSVEKPVKEDKETILARLNKQLEDSRKEMEKFKTNYVQEDRFFESYNLYKDSWDNKFRAEYRNPRIAEESQTAAATGKDRYDKQVNLRQSLAISPQENQSNPTPKTLGTGLSNSNGSNNPFGVIDSGLNI